MSVRTHGSGSARRGTTSPAGVIAALVILIGSGVGYRVASRRLARLTGGVPLARGTLGVLSKEIGDWSGEDVPLDEVIIERTDTDDHVNRTYRRAHSSDRVSLFIAYGIRIRDLMPHRPEVCYTGAGWTLDGARSEELTATDGTTVPCQVQFFGRGGLQTRRIAVLNYYIVDGRFYRDVSVLRSKGWKTGADFSYAVQVQVSSPSAVAGNAGSRSVRAFAAESAALFRSVIDQEVAKARPSDDGA